MKYQVLFSLKHNEKIFKTVVTGYSQGKKKMIRFDQFTAATKWRAVHRFYPESQTVKVKTIFLVNSHFSQYPISAAQESKLISL